jgi:hypothetical protein
MAESRISRISSASAEAATVTLGTHAKGDLILICAVRDGSVTNPTIPTGWTNITNTTDGTLISVSVGWKWATSAAETSGTWTNATGLMCHVYRGADPVTPFGTFGGGSTAATTVNYSASTGVTRARMDNQWIIRFAICTGVDTTTLNTAPTDCTNVINALGATQDMVSFDTNGPVQNGAAAQNITHGGASQNSINVMIPMYPPQMKLNNYQSVRSVSAGVMSVGERIR